MSVPRQSLGRVLVVLFDGVKASTQHELVDQLLSRGGMTLMLSTVALIICALSFSGVQAGEQVG